MSISMTMSIGKEAQFIAYVLRQTQAKTLRWERREPPQALWLGTDSKIFDFYCASLADKTLGLYEVRNRHYDGDRDQFFWGSDVQLALFDRVLNHEYTFNAAAGVYDLFSEVKRQVAGVDDFLDRIMEDKGTDN
jgi:hypothetical protein